MSSKKIIFLEQYSKVSGGQKVLLSVISGLNKDCYSPLVILPDKGELFVTLKEADIDVQILPIGYYSVGKKKLVDVVRYSFRLPFLIFFLNQIIKKEKANLVYANGARTFIWGVVACTLTKTPMVWHLHSIFYTKAVKWACIYFGKMCVVKKIIAVSDSVRRPLAALGEKIEIIYNGIDVKHFCSLSRDREQSCKRRKLLIIAGGLLIEWKNQEDLIKAAGVFIKKSNIPVEFLIVGGPLYKTQEGEGYQRRLKKLTMSLGLENDIIFTGHIKKMTDILQRADILVITSKMPDPCPLLMLEAMASGLAVISTNFGGPAEIIEDGQDGLLYLSGNYQQLAEKLIYLAKKSNRIKEIGKAARQKIEKQYSQIIFINKVNKVLNSLFL